MKLLKKLLGLTIASTLIVGCGPAKTDGGASGSSTEAANAEESKEEAFGAEMAKKYPVSDEMQAKLDSLDTNYSKIKWDVSYAPFDNEGIIVSETQYTEKGELAPIYNVVVVAITNLNDEPVEVSFKADFENTTNSRNVNGPRTVDGGDIWPGDTYVFTYNLGTNTPTGNVDWSEVSVETTDEEYYPYETTSVISLNDSGDRYIIESEVISDEYFARSNLEYVFIIDKEGNVLYTSDCGFEGSDSIDVEDVDFDCTKYEALFFIYT